MLRKGEARSSPPQPTPTTLLRPFNGMQASDNVALTMPDMLSATPSKNKPLKATAPTAGKPYWPTQRAAAA